MADSKKEKEEQARKAHAFAEKSFLAGNVLAAKMWMQSAVRLAPDLPGTPQIVAAYDVHVAAARSTRDWYDVLGLKPGGGGGGGVTYDDIKKQHRRLCLLVHPDKNPSAAADGAFKLIQAAWHALLPCHPPLGTAVPPAPPPPPPRRQEAAPPRPPPPQPHPRPRPPRPAPRWTWMPPPPPTYYPEPAKPKPKSKCPACGGLTINGRNNAPTLIGRNNYRCMSCLWSPKDGRRAPHEDDCDDDFFD